MEPIIASNSNNREKAWLWAVVGCGLLLEHEEKERQGMEVMGQVGAPRISRSGAWLGVVEEDVEVSGGSRQMLRTGYLMVAIFGNGGDLRLWLVMASLCWEKRDREILWCIRCYWSHR